MSSPQTKTEFLEDFFDIKTTYRDLSRRSSFVLTICFLLVVFGNIGLISYAESPLETVSPAAQIVFWTLFACFFVGQELAYRDAVNRTPGFGRKLRIVCFIALMAFFPFLSAAMLGQLYLSGDSDWLKGALFGGGAGLAVVVLLLLFRLYRYRKARTRT